MDIFKTRIHFEDNEDLSKKFLNICRESLSQIKENPNYLFGKTSYYEGNFYSETKSKYPDEWKSLENFILKGSINFLKEYEIDTDKISIGLTNIWVSQLNKGGSHEIHNHGGCQISGTFYINYNNDNSEIVFYRENVFTTFNSTFPSNLPIKKSNTYNNVSFSVKPKNGRMIFWKSDLLHKVPYNNCDDRIAVSFNLKVVNKKNEK